MDKRSILDVACRVIGLWQMTEFVSDLASYANVMAKLYEPFHESGNALLTLAAARFAMGFFLLFGARVIVKTVYGEALENTGTEQVTPVAPDQV